MSADKTVIHWFRRDLRLEDNTALFNALSSGRKVLCIFIFDKNILSEVAKDDHRVQFIYDSLKNIHTALRRTGSSLIIRHGHPEDELIRIAEENASNDIFFNEDYEPYATRRDALIRKLAEEKNIQVHSFKDQVIFSPTEILKKDGKPYLVFSPYKNKWLSEFGSLSLDRKSSEGRFRILNEEFPSLEEFGFCRTVSREIRTDAFIDKEKIISYSDTRNFPFENGTSRLSVHLRFGTVSIRDVVTIAAKSNQKFLEELIWREFFMMILFHFPFVVHRSFKKDYDNIEWRNNEHEFQLWKDGRTGFPLVDAGMRELNETGFMHNRVRMVTASFLVKHLLVDWRWGEAYFAQKLMDYELASNNGNWQWCAGSGVDAAPYFRIFNPAEQQKKFDPEFKYIRKYLPEFGSKEYPEPIVEHREARERCLATFNFALKKSK